MAKGTLIADELRVARIEVDLLTNPVKVAATAAFVDTGTGSTKAWATGHGSMWSRDTLQKLKELCVAMEDDMAKHLLSEHSVSAGGSAGQSRRPVGGIGERLGSAGNAEPPDAPSV